MSFSSTNTESMNKFMFNIGIGVSIIIVNTIRNNASELDSDVVVLKSFGTLPTTTICVNIYSSLCIQLI